VWDVPSAIVVGDRFRIKVGMKCSNECDLTDSPFDIYDEGLQPGSGIRDPKRDQGSGIRDRKREGE